MQEDQRPDYAALRILLENERHSNHCACLIQVCEACNTYAAWCRCGESRESRIVTPPCDCRRGHALALLDRLMGIPETGIR